jgi:hypothetical protein
MNNTHYPSLELCKKLTEENYPATSNWMKENWDIIQLIYWAWKLYYRCPSIAELLNSLREDRRRVAHRQYSELKDNTSFPDYLAEFYLFDKENNYLHK